MDNLSDRQVIARVRRLWPSHSRLMPITERLGWDYRRVYDILQRNAVLTEFGLGRRQRNPRRRKASKCD